MADASQRKFQQLLRFGGAFALTQLVAYFFIILSGRLLAPQAFAHFNALLGLLMLGGVFANALQAAATQVIARAPELARGPALLRWTLQLSMWPVGLFAGGLVLLGDAIGINALQALLCLLVFAAMALSAAPAGAMQALGHVRLQTELGLVGALLRLALGAGMLLLDWQVVACLAAYVANYVFVGLAAYLWLRSPGRPGAASIPSDARLALEPKILLSLLFGLAPFTLDQVLVSSYTPAEASTFAALSTAAKVVFFAAQPIMAWTYPALLHAVGRQERRRILKWAGVAMMLLPGLVSGIFAIFPEVVLEQMFGLRAMEAARELPLLCLGVFFFSMSSLLVQVSVAVGAPAVWPSAVVLAGGWLLYATRHESLSIAVENQACMYVVQLALLVVHLAWLTKARKLDL